ncbi:MAG: hypothetical protein ABSA21_07250 [Candidatus Limnocylindrales bacterium]
MANRPSSSDSPPSPGESADSRPLGLGAQFARTRTALSGLISAHVKLLFAELAEIMGELKRAVALGGIALGLLFLAGMVACIGSILWLDEWVFGSIGWGALHGSLLLIAVAVTLVLLIVPNSALRIGLGFFVALVAAVAVFLIFWLQLTSRAWGWVGSSFFGGLTWFDGHAVSAADRPIAVAVIVLAVLFGVLGAIAGLIVGSGFLKRVAAAVGIAIAGAAVGGLLGALLGVPMSWGIAIAVALAVFLPLHTVLAAFFVLRKVNFKELKNRFIPNQTIATTKETIEWVRAQMPLGRKS